MRKLLVTFLLSIVGVHVMGQSLTKAERTKALEHLKTTQSDLMASFEGLTEEQLNYKASEDSWSIAECLEHLAISETNLFGIVEMTLQNTPDPSKRSEVAMSDDQLLGLIQSRDQKVKTRPEFEPSMKYGGFDGSVKAFKTKRKENMKFVKSTDEDLRNRYFDFPFGKVDAYQVILFMSGHTQRHKDQIEEIKSSAAFPQS